MVPPFAGLLLTNDTGLDELLSINKALIVNVKDPLPGVWTMRIWADGPHTIRATGLSSLDFVHGFSRKPTLDITTTLARPIRGRS